MIFLQLFWSFFKIGLFTIGGGYAMIPLIQQTVLSNNWMTQDAFVDFIGVAESTPGVFAVNLATYVGATVSGGGALGLLGAFMATLGVVLPSVIIITLIAKFLHATLSKNKFLSTALKGAGYAIVGLLFYSFLSVFIMAIFSAENVLSIDFAMFDYKALIIFGVATLLGFWKKPKIHPIIIIVISAGLGMLLYSLP